MVRKYDAPRRKRVPNVVPPCKYYFSIISSKNIHNSIVPEQALIEKLNEQNGFFHKLEESVLKEGIINPILVSIGWAPKSIINKLPEAIQDNFDNEFVCFCKGGSRLMIAQKYNMDVPCIVSDFVGRFAGQKELDDVGIAKCFKSGQVQVLHGGKGVAIRDLPDIHLDPDKATLKGFSKVTNPLKGYTIKFSVVEARKIQNPLVPNEDRMKKLNAETGFFDKLEASILKEGIRNPIVINAYIENDEVVLENRYGGSRLMLAQKHDMEISCIIADFDNIFPDAEILKPHKIKDKFQDKPRHVKFKTHGINVSGCEDYHLI